jgi:DNA-binding NarL/FixJ family response regulator
LSDKTSLKILFIDDEEMQLFFIKPMIQSFDSNIDVVTLSDPLKVFDDLKKENFDCVIVDYTMPKISGIDLIKNIKGQMDIPCILYTGRDQEDVYEEAINVGVDAVIQKIMNPEDYVKLIKIIRDLVKN